MKTLWFDLSDAFLRSGRITGIQRVVYEISSRFSKEYEGNVRFFFYDPASQTFVLCEPPQPAEQQVSVSKPAGSIWAGNRQLKSNTKRAIHLITPPLVWKAKAKLSKPETIRPQIVRKPDSLFATDDTIVILGGNWDKPRYIERLMESITGKNIRIIHHIHDLIPIFDKGHVSGEEHTRFPEYMKQAITVSDVVTVTADYVRTQLDQFIADQGLKAPRSIVKIHLGDNITGKVAPKKPTGMRTKLKRYILCVGTVEIRKNHTLLYYAYKRAREKGIELPHLVIAGRVGWMSEEIRFMMTHDPEISDKITLLHEVTDSELSWLYGNCLFSIFPSFSEGWGLPVAESLARQSFCIASNATSIPEIAGNLIDYFSPFSVDDCLQKIDLYANQPALLLERKQIATKYQLWSWDKTYEQYLGAIRL